MQPPKQQTAPSKADDKPPKTTIFTYGLREFQDAERTKAMVLFTGKYATKAHIYEPDKPITLTLTKTALQQIKEEKDDPNKHIRYSYMLMPAAQVVDVLNKIQPVALPAPPTLLEELIDNHKRVEGEAELVWRWPTPYRSIGTPIRADIPIPIAGKNIQHLLQTRYLEHFNHAVKHYDLNGDSSGTPLNDQQRDDKAARYAYYYMKLDALYNVKQFYKTYGEKAPHANQETFDRMLETTKKELLAVGFTEYGLTYDPLIADITDDFKTTLAARQKAKQAAPAPQPKPAVEPFDPEDLGALKQQTHLPKQMGAPRSHTKRVS